MLGATARRQTDFGELSGFGTISGEYFSLGNGTDIARLLRGLEGDFCQTPHWGHVIKGSLVVTYANGSDERAAGGDLSCWPPGHSVRVSQDAELVLFSAQDEHTHVMDHLLEKMAS